MIHFLFDIFLSAKQPNCRIFSASLAIFPHFVIAIGWTLNLLYKHGNWPDWHQIIEILWYSTHLRSEEVKSDTALVQQTCRFTVCTVETQNEITKSQTSPSPSLQPVDLCSAHLHYWTPNRHKSPLLYVLRKTLSYLLHLHWVPHAPLDPWASHWN